MKKVIKVNNSIQQNYSYELTEKEGKNFDPEFKPDLTPKQMLELGVFGGNYAAGFQEGTEKDFENEFPNDWFSIARKKGKLIKDVQDKKANLYGVNASLPLSTWQNKGWIYVDDPLGWFQWYCRYFAGRRFPAEDKRQIKRWKNMVRHVGAVAANCRVCDVFCRPRQRQALLHWAYDSQNI